MAHTSIVNRSRVLATATALSAAGFVVNPPPAQAIPMLPLAPPCTQYAFAGSFAIQQSNGYTVVFNATGTSVNGRGYVKAQTGQTDNARVKGSIIGRDIQFTVEYDKGGSGSYGGTVDDNGNVSGSTSGSFKLGDLIPVATWSGGRVVCATPPAAPPPVPASTPKPAELGAVATGPATLQAGLSGTYVVTVSNKGGVPSAPVDLLILFAGKLEQTGQIVAGGGFCELRGPDAGINAAVRCTGPQLEPGATVDFTVQGRGSTPGAGSLLAKLGSDVNQKDVAIT